MRFDRAIQRWVTDVHPDTPVKLTAPVTVSSVNIENIRGEVTVTVTDANGKSQHLTGDLKYILKTYGDHDQF